MRPCLALSRPFAVSTLNIIPAADKPDPESGITRHRKIPIFRIWPIGGVTLNFGTYAVIFATSVSTRLSKKILQPVRAIESNHRRTCGEITRFLGPRASPTRTGVAQNFNRRTRLPVVPRRGRVPLSGVKSDERIRGSARFHGKLA